MDSQDGHGSLETLLPCSCSCTQPHVMTYDTPPLTRLRHPSVDRKQLARSVAGLHFLNVLQSRRSAIDAAIPGRSAPPPRSQHFMMWKAAHATAVCEQA